MGSAAAAIGIIKNSKKAMVLKRHPWIFSGAFVRQPTCPPGSFGNFVDEAGAFIACGFLNAKSQITGRILSFTPVELDALLHERMDSALKRRRALLGTAGDAFRWVNAEADGLPGLVVDVYRDKAVIQISTAGMENLRAAIVSLIESIAGITAVYEKSSAGSRQREGLSARHEGWLTAVPSDPWLTFTEHGITYRSLPEKSQKTGFFLDQRDMRWLVRSLSQGRRVLNTFSYSGGFSFNALLGGARSVTAVDSSEDACTMHRDLLTENKIAGDCTVICDDALHYLGNDRSQYDLIILDPPAFAKKPDDGKRAFGHYRHLNELGLARLAPGGILLTFSCSPFMPEESFQAAVYEAGWRQGLDLCILRRHTQAFDHPVSLYHREGAYLKGLVLGRS